MNNYIVEYNSSIENGTAKVGLWIRKLYKLILEGLESGKWYFDSKKANRAIKFIENFCHHSKGRNDLLKLELWQKALVALIFGIVDDTGLRQFREVVIIMGKKNGKSLLAAAIMAYMAFADGEYGAELYCIAPKLDQADIVYSCFYQMVLSEDELDNEAEKRRSDIYIASTNTFVKPIAFNEKKSEGYNPHFVNNDEIASWRGRAGLRQYETLKSAVAARSQPLILSISTSGYENDSIYDELIKRGTSVLQKSSKESRLLPIFYMIDDIEKWNDLDELYKSNPNLGVSISIEYLKEEIRIALGSASKKAEFLTKYCNIKQNSSSAFLEFEIVEKSSKDKFELKDFYKTYGVGGIDLSQTTDLTAASVVIQKDGIDYVFTQFFMPKNRLESAIETDHIPYDIFVAKGYLTLSGENYVDYNDVKAWFDMLKKEYKIYVVKIGYDRYSSQYLVDEMANAGYQMDDVIQGWNLSPIIKNFEGSIKDGAIKIGNNNLLKAHFLNVALKYEQNSNKFKPIKISQESRIDGFVSVIDALTVREKYFNEIKFLILNKRKKEKE